jgi:hypothetical protein
MFHARSYPEGTGSGHASAFGADTAAQWMLHYVEMLVCRFETAKLNYFPQMANNFIK